MKKSVAKFAASLQVKGSACTASFEQIKALRFSSPGGCSHGEYAVFLTTLAEGTTKQPRRLPYF